MSGMKFGFSGGLGKLGGGRDFKLPFHGAGIFLALALDPGVGNT